MHTVKRIEVDGFWGNQRVAVDFDKNVNFLIGKNGCGKTTLINLLAATLKLDFDTLERQSFDRINVELRDSDSRSIAELEIQKSSNRGALAAPAPLLIRFRKKKSDQWIEQDTSAYVEFRRRYRTTPPREINLLQDGISNILNDMVRLTWLSIHRSTLGRRFEDAEGTESTVDKKVKELAVNFGSYLSSLDTKAAKVTKNFQEYVFLSLLFDPNANYNPWRSHQNVDVDSERGVLANIFRQFAVPEESFEPKLEQHFSAVSQAIRHQGQNNNALTIPDVVALTDTQRIRHLVAEWQKSQSRLQEIYQPKDTFQNIINSLFVRKGVKIDERNRPYVETESKTVFGPEGLSSGEKQLFILLGEVLLQEKQPYIFIADEPELSLHVEWQSTLVQHLTQLNPNMQIIFATHSPDIVSTYQDRVIRMEEKVA